MSKRSENKQTNKNNTWGSNEQLLRKGAEPRKGKREAFSSRPSFLLPPKQHDFELLYNGEEGTEGGPERNHGCPVRQREWERARGKCKTELT